MAKQTAPVLHHLDPASIVMQDQVRVERDEKADKELLASVTKRGILQPIRARKVGDKIIVIDGHRRLEAAQAAKLETIPVYIVGDQTAHEVLTDQMVANIQRADMSLGDTAKGVRKLYEGPGGGSASYVADKLSKPNSWVSKMLVIAGSGKNPTPAPITARLLAADKITDLDAAYTLAKIEAVNPKQAEELAKDIGNQTRASLKKALAAAKPPKAGTDESDESEEKDYTEALEWALEQLRRLAPGKKAATLQADAIEYLEAALGEDEAEEEAPM